MLPLLPVLFLIFAGGTLLYQAFKEDPELKGINSDNIHENYLINQDNEKLPLTQVKRRTTRAINTIIRNCKGFKIGKSGNPDGRRTKVDYHIYSKIFVLCVSEDKSFISDLESHYNGKYISSKKNDNKKTGSAGVTTDKNGKHYLYIAVR